ncbi:translation initiation factor IF-3 [Mariniphaga anaerophila]|nr:translation initiation factor IF-3 [Mariniphaga anaerophila]
MAIKRRGGQHPFRRKETGPQHRINRHITAPQIRLVGDNIENPGVFALRDALRLSEEKELDLVEISPKADPPVCKIIDYSKFLYQQKKKQKEMKAKAVKVVVKEIRFGPQTDEHDFEFKLRHAEKFLKDGAKVKAYVFFKGRSILFKEQGEILLLRLATELEELGTVEQMPKLEGKRMIMMISPKKK